MSLGALRDEADLKRWLEQQLQTPGVLPVPPALFKNVKFGVVTSTFPGGSNASTPVEVTHNLGDVPTGVWLTNLVGQAGFFWEASTLNKDTFLAAAQDPFGAPAEGIVGQAFWWAVV
jgi:hypothetical protein